MWKSKFGQWLEDNCSGVEIGAIDYIVFLYDEGWYITLEEKETSAHLRHIITKALTRGYHKPQHIPNPHYPEYRGHYVIAFEHSNPEDSDWYVINGRTFKKKDKALEILLTTGKF